MPKKFPAEFKRDVVRVARRGDLKVAEVAVDFGVAEETVRRWMRQADVDDGVREGLTTTEQQEVVRLRRENRRLEMENEILRRGRSTRRRRGASGECDPRHPRRRPDVRLPVHR